MARILDGKALALQLRQDIKSTINGFVTQGGILPGLAVMVVGNDIASRVYVNSKKKACAEVGILSHEIVLPADVGQTELFDSLQELNHRPDIHGILLQLPLPSHIDEQAALQAIDPAKDVDGFHPINVGRLVLGQPGFVPCTPLGALRLLQHHAIECRGKRALIVGRSTIVGKPMFHLLLGEHATVTIAHSRTIDLPSRVAEADIVVAAIGKPEFIKGDWIKPDAVVVDVGINSVPAPELAKGSRLVGDVEFAAAAERASWITPVPGGIGPMTIAMLLANTVQARNMAVSGV